VEQSPDSTAETAPKRGLRAWLAHAFAVEPYDETSLSAEEKAALDRIALGVHAKGMTAAAITWAESNRNMNWLGSQALIFANPLYDLGKGYINAFLRIIGLARKNTLLLSSEELNTLAAALEKRYSIEYFVQRLEQLESGGRLDAPDQPAAPAGPPQP